MGSGRQRRKGDGSELTVIKRARDELAEHGIETLSVMGLVVVWQLIAMAIDNPLKLPSFLQVDLPVSLVHFMIGMVAGLLVALPIGMAMG